MSINTQLSIHQGDRTIALVEITDDKDPDDLHQSWEFHCEACDEFCTELSEADARDELANHKCGAKFFCTCGYGPSTPQDIEEHIIALMHVDEEHHRT